MQSLLNRLQHWGIALMLIIMAAIFYLLVLLDLTVGWFLGVRADLDFENPSGRLFWPYKARIKGIDEVPCNKTSYRLAPWEIAVPLAFSVWYLTSNNRLVGTLAVTGMLTAAFSFAMTTPLKSPE